VGLTLVTGNGTIQRAYAIPAEAENVGNIATAFSKQILKPQHHEPSKNIAEPTSIINLIVNDWRELGGELDTDILLEAQTRSRSPHVQLLQKRDFDIRQLRPRTSRSPAQDSVNWSDVTNGLKRRGVVINRRPTKKVVASEFLSPLTVGHVFECVDKTGKVVSEGKGLSVHSARRAALAEAIERITAQNPTKRESFVGSRREVVDAGLSTPKIAAGSRDLFSEDLILEWYPAFNLDGAPGAVPAELVLYPASHRIPVRSFSIHHTAGLAAGSSTGEAAAAAILELIETDCYWISMRMHQVCGKFVGLGESSSLNVRHLVAALHEQGIAVHAGLISFDWPLSVVHVVLENMKGQLPALSHGLGSSFSHDMAIEKALLEAIQVFSGLQKVAVDYWPDITMKSETSAEPLLFWSDPSRRKRIVEYV
jgi:hypothetical protein